MLSNGRFPGSGTPGSLLSGPSPDPSGSRMLARRMFSKAQRPISAGGPRRGSTEEFQLAERAHTGDTGPEWVLAGPAPAAPATASNKTASTGQKGMAEGQRRQRLEAFHFFYRLKSLLYDDGRFVGAVGLTLSGSGAVAACLCGDLMIV
jgi:hypothetical protein